MKNNNIKSLSFLLIISLAFFSFFLGPNFSNPTNSNWLRTLDLISYQDAWNFFKNDKWRFPIGKLPNYGIDIGNSIVYADIIPLFAIIFKFLKNFCFLIFNIIQFGYFSLFFYNAILHF